MQTHTIVITDGDRTETLQRPQCGLKGGLRFEKYFKLITIETDKKMLLAMWTNFYHIFYSHAKFK